MLPVSTSPRWTAASGERSGFLPFSTRTGISALVTTGTVTSAALLSKRLPAGALHQYVPLDSPFFLRRFLAHWRPDAALFAESELWPNMIVELKRAGSPLAMINGRISERSFNRWQKLPGFIGALLSHFDLCLARSEGDAERVTSPVIRIRALPDPRAPRRFTSASRSIGLLTSNSTTGAGARVRTSTRTATGAPGSATLPRALISKPPAPCPSSKSP